MSFQWSFQNSCLIKTYISNLVRTTRFWNNHHQIRSLRRHYFNFIADEKKPVSFPSAHFWLIELATCISNVFIIYTIYHMNRFSQVCFSSPDLKGMSCIVITWCPSSSVVVVVRDCTDQSDYVVKLISNPNTLVVTF